VGANRIGKQEMKDSRFSALWVLIPLTGTLVAFTGGMLFLGWFATDFGFAAHSPLLITAFVAAVLITIAVIGGYLGAQNRRIRPSVLFSGFAALLVVTFSALTIGSMVEAFSGDRFSIVLTALGGFLTLFFGVLLKRSLGRIQRKA
jgi:hypothetical protein